MIRNPLAFTAADLNGDGRLDIIATDATNDISVLVGNGDGTFQSEQRFTAGTSGDQYLRGVAVGDFNGDGRPDIATNNWVQIFPSTHVGCS